MDLVVESVKQQMRQYLIVHIAYPCSYFWSPIFPGITLPPSSHYSPYGVAAIHAHDPTPFIGK